ncbi:AI-2E family transporter [Yunchengibacter salinarum]|uniref:AI-2E family transporter n=1 Tax=Yunchengibacter salinarum TaxID=3133399 RepID=UPI0035B68F6F
MSDEPDMTEGGAGGMAPQQGLDPRLPWWVWGIVALVLLVFIYVTRAVLLPFIAGLAVAYLLDPLTDRLEARGVPRGGAAGLVIAFFFLLLTGLVLAFWPILEGQLAAVSRTLPETLAGLRHWLDGVLAALSEQTGMAVTQNVESLLQEFSSTLLERVRGALGSLLQSGFAIFNLLTLLLITPVVAFYLLRDWDRLVARLNGWLPPRHAHTLRRLASNMDMVLSGFVRGQILVSLIMGVLYGVGWTLVGLEFGAVLGLLAGIMAFVPFVGALFAALIAVAMAFGQWGMDPMNLALVIGVYVVVQALEGSVLTPRLVGSRVGLHPVWVLFAVFAGGEVMGFVGVLVAVPVAAAIAVLVRHAIDRYLDHLNIRQLPEEARRPNDGEGQS